MTVDDKPSEAVEAEAVEVNEQGETAVSPANPHALERRPPTASPATLAETRSLDQLVERRKLIEGAMSELMRDGEHYGVIPGTERKDKDGKDISKPTLLQPGAQLLCSAFMLEPQFDTRKSFAGDGHLDVEAFCTLVHIPTQTAAVTRAEGYCTTREERYAYRWANRTCPECGKPAVLRSKDKPEWFCWRKRDGCGRSFADGTPGAAALAIQEEGKVPNPNLADTYNTVVKMAEKRALVAAVLLATGASDVFTQDLEDKGEDAGTSSAPAGTEQQSRTDTKDQDDGKPTSAQLKLAMKKFWECKAADGFRRYNDDRSGWQTITPEQALDGIAGWGVLVDAGVELDVGADESKISTAERAEATFGLLTRAQLSAVVSTLQNAIDEAQATT